MISTIFTCDVCGFPGCCSPLVRMTWHYDDPACVDPTKGKIVVAPKESDSPTFICEWCIRGIKALPFSDISEAPKVSS